MKYYKVVTDQLRSVIDIFSGTENKEKWVVQYKPGEFVYPVDNTKLFVFAEYIDADVFTYNHRRYGTLQLWECEVLNSEQCYALGLCSRITEWWRYKNFAQSPPHSTRSCDGVKLIKCVG